MPMTVAISETPGTRATLRQCAVTGRALLVVILVTATLVGFLATAPDAASQAVTQSGADLTRLLRAMAGIKALMAAGLAASVLWRLGAAITLPWFAAYAVACAAMAAGPGLIWGLVHVGIGAALLHGGLLACVLLLWRDPVVGTSLASLVAARRSSLAARTR